LFGKYIYNYLAYKSIPIKAKVSALILIWVSIPFTCYLIANTIVTIILPTLALIVSIYILRLKTLKKIGNKTDKPEHIYEIQINKI
jgi:uncharacterized membrane protein YbaN (DUF454 family)